MSDHCNRAASLREFTEPLIPQLQVGAGVVVGSGSAAIARAVQLNTPPWLLACAYKRTAIPLVLESICSMPVLQERFIYELPKAR